jgi:S1-C subfamily serine protease
MARITDITSVVASELAIADQRPAYATTDRDVQIRQQSKAYLGVSLQEPTDRPETQGNKGNPGDIGNPGGAVVSAVSAGSPADMAGIRVGDRLVRIDSIPIRSVADLIDHVGDSEIDAVVKIELVRGGQSIEISARLQRRPGD